ncbi:hypothetical protein, partial [Methylobacterium frigidaeris]|uniref:hypothetical protein n=1 Tax=Methylobacterium frigidaeris TaxID=2038277 RepID=UPI001EE131A9
MADFLLRGINEAGRPARESAAQLLARIPIPVGDGAVPLPQALLDRPTQADIAARLAEIAEEAVSADELAAAVEPIADRVAAVEAGQASGSLSYATLAELTANLTPPDGATAQVLTGDEAGSYRKSGPSGSGSWARYSTATLPSVDARLSVEVAARQATDARTAEVQLRPDGTLPWWAVAGRTSAGALVSLLRLSTQGDWLVRRLRLERVPRRYGEVVGGLFGPKGERFLWVNSRLEVCARVLRVATAHAHTPGGLFGPRGERLAYLNAMQDWCARRLRLPRGHNAALGGFFGPRGERLLWVSERGEARARALRTDRIGRR